MSKKNGASKQRWRQISLMLVTGGALYKLTGRRCSRSETLSRVAILGISSNNRAGESGAGGIEGCCLFM